LLFDSLTTPARCRELVDAYHAAGGAEPCVLVRRAWVGDPPAAETARQLDTYRSYAGNATTHWGADELAASTDPAEVADRLVAAATSAGADALNVRVHMPGVGVAAVREQIERTGNECLPRVVRALAKD
jgi:phage terminase large subunit-like protein